LSEKERIIMQMMRKIEGEEQFKRLKYHFEEEEMNCHSENENGNFLLGV
jgi:hypothetical protein